MLTFSHSTLTNLNKNFSVKRVIPKNEQICLISVLPLLKILSFVSHTKVSPLSEVLHCPCIAFGTMSCLGDKRKFSDLLGFCKANLDTHHSHRWWGNYCSPWQIPFLYKQSEWWQKGENTKPPVFMQRKLGRKNGIFNSKFVHIGFET